MNIKNDFPWLVKNKYIYFDNGATTLKPNCVIDAIKKYYVDYGTNVHNLDSKFCYQTFKVLQNARQTIASIFNAQAKNVAFCSGTTEGLSLIAHGLAHILPKNSEVLLNDFEHASNLIPWQHEANSKHFKLKFAKLQSEKIEDDIFNAITNKTKIISIALTSNVYGNMVDYKALVTKIRRKWKNIVIIADAAQYIPYKNVDTKCGIDFVVCSAHKMLGPTGIGAVYIANKWLDKLPPLRFGGGMNEAISHASFTYAHEFEKFEGGSLPSAQILGWQAAIKYLNKVGREKIYQHGLELKKYFVKRAKEVKDLVIFNPNTPLATILINYKKVHSQDFANWLGSKGFIVRAGLSCAKLSKHPLKVDNFVRASLYLYNTKLEIDKFIYTIKKFKCGDELKAIF